MSKAKRHSDGGACCECGGMHECEACPTFDAPKVATKGPVLSTPEVEAFALAIEEYSDGMGRTYDTPECDDAYNVGRTVAEVPGKWWPVLAQAPAMLAALREVKRLRDLWRSQDDAVSIDSIAYMDGLDRIDVDAIVAAAEGGAR